MLQRCLLVILSCALFGCAAPRDFYRAKSIAVNRPEVGVLTTARPGENLLSQGTQSEYDAIESSAPFPVGSFVLPAGKYLKNSESNIAEFFSWDEVSSPTQGGIVSDGNSLKEVVLVKGRGALIVQTFGTKLYVVDSHPFRRIKATVLDRDSFQQTLIYSGKIGSKINISYRESSGGMARPAFTNAAEYDLSESSTIGYLGAQIEVIEATNQLIRYRVISNFSKSQR